MRLELRELDDTALVEAARSGDRQALDVLVAAALPLVYNVVGRALDGHHDADDVVQETLIRAVDRLGDLRDPAAFRSWLVAIAIRQVRDRWRQVQARPGVGAYGLHGADSAQGPHGADTALDAADPGADFVDLTILRLELSDQRRETALATRWLDPDDRELLALWWLEAAGQLSRADLAAALGLSAGHASVRVQRMRQQLETARTVVRALAFAPRCGELDEVAKSWDGRPASVWRKRFARHVRECVDCGGVVRGLVPAERLLAGLALVPVPAGLAGGWAVRSAAAGSAGRHVVASRGVRSSRHAADHAHRSGWFAGHVSAKVVAIGASLATVGAAGVVYAAADTGHNRSGKAVVAPPPSTAPVTAPPAASTTAPRPTPTPTPASVPGLVSLGTIGLSAPLAYLTPGYNGMPEWTRVDTQAAPDGSVQVAWPASDGVRVTPLTSAGRRRGPDVVVPGAREVGGLVAHDDGFALLTRVPDANKWGDTAAELVRFRDGTRVFAARLTGSASDDTAPTLDSQLRWNGGRYGAYFVVRGAGGPADGHYGDKLTYVSGTGAVLSGGWSWGCSHNEGIALYPEASGPFTSLCFDDWRSGLFVSTGIGAPDVAPVVQREQCWAGYCGGTFPGNAGTLVKSAAGRYATAFASRGAASAGKNSADSSGRGWSVTARTATHQVVVAFLKDGSTPAGAPVRLTDESGVDHVNVRIAPLGPDRLLVSWEDVAVASCAEGTCQGRFAGTRLRVVDWTGKALGPDQTVDARIAGEVAARPDGSLIWAFAQATPNDGGPLSASPTTSTLSIVEYRP